MKKCPICKSEKNSFFFQKKKFSYFTYPMKDNSKNKLLKKYSKRLYMNAIFNSCKKCGHIFLKSSPSSEILDILYKKHYIYFSADKQKKFSLPLKENFFLQQIKKIKLNNRKTLEIGCNDGFLLSELKKRNYDVTGVEPGSSAIAAKKNGLRVIKNYYSPNIFKKNNEKFDLIICRHLLEHIKNCDAFIKSLKKIMQNHATLAIEVPNVSYYIKKNSSETFFLQHYHYFSIYSLEKLFNQNEMKIFKSVNSEGDIIIFVRNSKKKSKKNSLSSWKKRILKFHKDIQIKSSKIENFFKKNIDENEKILCWGAGGYLYQLFHSFPFLKEFISFIIDNDKKKWGLTFIENNIKIISPKKVNLKKFRIIIITSSMFLQSIKKDLLTRGFKGKILSVHPKLKKINI